MLKLNVEELLKQRHMSKQQFCVQTGITRWNLNQAIRNHNSISYKYLETFCKTLNCEIGELLVFTDDEK